MMELLSKQVRVQKELYDSSHKQYEEAPNTGVQLF